MINEEQLWFRITIIVLNLVSILACASIVWTFWKIPKFNNNNPGRIVHRITILQFIYSTFLLLSQFYVFKDQQSSLAHFPATFVLNEGTCAGLGTFTTIVQTIYNIYNILLVMNICYILKNKSDRFNAHFFKCEIVALVLSISTSSIACYFGDLSQGYFCTPINHISILGNCYLSQSSPIQIIASIVGCLILIALFIVVVAVIHISNQMIEPDIVQKKSLIRLYVLYSLVFTATRSQQIFFFIWQSFGTYPARGLNIIFLIIVSTGGLLLFIIRVNEPTVNKFLRRQFTLRPSQKLMGKLTINSETSLQGSTLRDPLLIDSKNDIQSLEITMYQESSRMTIMEVVKFDYQIKSLGEFMQILCAVSFAMHQQTDSIFEDETQICPYTFKHIVQRKLIMGLNAREMEHMAKRGRNSSDKPMVELDTQVGYSRICSYSYAQKFFLTQQQKTYHVTQEHIKQSLEMSNNYQGLKELVGVAELNRLGTVYITEDGLISIDVITTAEKARLMSGGLLRFYRRQKEALDCSLLPAIIGLHCIQLDRRRCVNVLVKLNCVGLNYPLCQRTWDSQSWKPQFVNKNIIGWVTISVQESKTRFLANSVVDGLFSIKLNVVESDFKIYEEQKNQLIGVLQRDVPLLVSPWSTYELNFVYVKFSSQRLHSIYKHEQKNEFQRDTLAEDSEGTKIIQLLLESKIGYVKVFFEEVCNDQQENTEQEMQFQLDQLIARVNEYI